MQYANTYGVVGHDRARAVDAQRPAGRGGFLAELVSRIRGRFEEQARYLRTRDELMALSDRELDDIGLKRAEIEVIARRSARSF